MSSSANGRVLRRIERGDQRILPGAVQAERHQVVHQVVARARRCGTRRRPAPACPQAAPGASRNGCLVIADLPVTHNHSAAARATLCSCEINHVGRARKRRIERCPNCPKSRRCAAASSRRWRARASPRSRCIAATCAGRCRRISPQRLEGKTVTGLGRRAKYLLADLSSGDVLVMHLGMSGSFHVFAQGAARTRRAPIITSAPSTSPTTTWCFTCRPAPSSPSTIRAASAR